MSLQSLKFSYVHAACRCRLYVTFRGTGKRLKWRIIVIASYCYSSYLAKLIDLLLWPWWKRKRTIYLSYLTQKFFSLLACWILPFTSGLILFWFSYLTQQVVCFTFFTHMNLTFRCFLAQSLYPSLQAPMPSTRVATHYRLEELHI